MICKNCNRENRHNANFCSFCGSPLSKEIDSNIKEFEDDEEIVYFDPYEDEQDDVDDFELEEDENYYNADSGNNNDNNKKIIAIVSVIAVVLIGMFFISKLDFLDGNSKSSVASSEENVDKEENENAHFKESDSTDIQESEQKSEMKTSEKEVQTLSITNTECSSILHDSTNKDYGSTRVLDGDFSTVWSEGVSGYGEGEWIRLDLSSIHTVKKIKIVNGLVNKKNGYYNNHRAKSMVLRFSDGSTQTIYLEDNNTGYQVVEIEPVETNYVQFVIDSVYYGSKYDDTCIADIEILGY